MLGYVEETVSFSVMSDKFTRAIKLFHDAWQSKQRYEKEFG